MLARRAFSAGLIGLAACVRRASPSGAARRIISISPSTTESVFALGAGDRLVARSRYCDYPADVARLPAVGGYVDPNLEAILSLRPDLVIGARGPAGPSLTERLAARGVGTYFPSTESLAEIDTMLLGLGERLGLHDAATALVREISAARDAVAARVRARKKPKTLLLFGVTPIVAAGPGSFADEMLSLAGGDNVVGRTGPKVAYPTLDLERVMALDPDVILDAATEEHGGDRLSAAWQSVRAVRAGRVITLPDPVVLRPGPRVALGAAKLAEALHP